MTIHLLLLKVDCLQIQYTKTHRDHQYFNTLLFNAFIHKCTFNTYGKTLKSISNLLKRAIISTGSNKKNKAQRAPPVDYTHWQLMGQREWRGDV
jgi:hypothetical protein